MWNWWHALRNRKDEFNRLSTSIERRFRSLWDEQERTNKSIGPVTHELKQLTHTVQEVMHQCQLMKQEFEKCPKSLLSLFDEARDDARKSRDVANSVRRDYDEFTTTMAREGLSVQGQLQDFRGEITDLKSRPLSDADQKYHDYLWKTLDKLCTEVDKIKRDLRVMTSGSGKKPVTRKKKSK